LGNGPATDPYKRPFETILDGALILDATTARILLANKAPPKCSASPHRRHGRLNPLDYIPVKTGTLSPSCWPRPRDGPPGSRRDQGKNKDGRVIWGSVTSALTQHEGRKATLITIREITSEKAKTRH